MKTLPRNKAIAAIRRRLLEFVDDEHSMCQAAAAKGIYCHGFRQYSDEELGKRYDWLTRGRPDIGREELEDLANRWQIARQIVDDVTISCDAQTLEQDTCRGWDGFDNAKLAQFYREVLSHEIQVVD